MTDIDKDGVAGTIDFALILCGKPAGAGYHRGVTIRASAARPGCGDVEEKRTQQGVVGIHSGTL